MNSYIGLLPIPSVISTEGICNAALTGPRDRVKLERLWLVPTLRIMYFKGVLSPFFLNFHYLSSAAAQG